MLKNCKRCSISHGSMDVFIEDNNGSLLSCGESIAVSVKKKHSKFSVKKNKFASSVVVVVAVAVAALTMIPEAKVTMGKVT